MGQAKYVDRPLTPQDMGGEFDFGNRVHGKMTVRLGPGLIHTYDGAIRRRPRWFASWFDCIIACMALVFAFGLGLLIDVWSEADNTTELIAYLMIGCAIAIVFAIAYRLQQVGW